MESVFLSFLSGALICLTLPLWSCKNNCPIAPMQAKFWATQSLVKEENHPFNHDHFGLQAASFWSWTSCISIPTKTFMTSAPNQARFGKQCMGLPGGCHLVTLQLGWWEPSTVNRLVTCHCFLLTWPFIFRAARHLLIVMHTSLLSFAGMPGIAVHSSEWQKCTLFGTLHEMYGYKF